MQAFERVFVLASSMAAVAAVGTAPSAQAATPHSVQAPAAPCPQGPSTTPQTGAALTVTPGADGNVTLRGEVAAGMKAPLTYSFHFGDDLAAAGAAALVQHAYAFNASYFPTVTVTDADGTSVTSAACELSVGSAKDSVHRYAGDDRYLTSSAVSQKLWADAAGDADTTSRRQAKAVVLASGGGFADALAGVPLAAYKQGPLLLTEPTGLTKTTEDEIKRVLPAGATVYVLGGQSALSPTVDAKLRADGYRVTRYAGTDRYGTAMQIATSGLDNPASAIVVTGTDFADALAAGPAATGDALSSQGKPAAIVLSDGATITDSATAAFVKARLGTFTTPTGPQQSTLASHVVALGGKSYCAVQDVDIPGYPCLIPPPYIGGGPVFENDPGGRGFEAVIGTDRYQTAALVANTLPTHWLPDPNVEFGGYEDDFGLFGLASGATYADALTGGAAMAVQHAPILLTARDYFPDATGKYIAKTVTQPAPYNFEADIFGGPAAIAPALQDAVTAKIRP